MKLRQFLRGFTLIELLVVISIIAVLASFAIPAIGPAMGKVARTKDMNNARQIYTGLLLFAGDNDGMFPSTPPITGNQTTGVGSLTDSNTAYRNICPTYVPKEAMFYVAGSAWSPKPPDEVTTNNQNLQPGENQYAYVMGLSQTSPPAWPLVADGFAQGGNMGGQYASDPSVPGGVWKGQFAVVVSVDGAASIMKCTQAMTVFGPTGSANGSANIFVQDATVPWLSGTGVQVLNPLGQ